jgi:ankyrin repeat protein
VHKLLILFSIVFFIGTAHAAADTRLNESLFASIKENNLPKVMDLVESGADVNARNIFNYTPLMFTTNVEIAAYLIKKGARLDAEMPNGENAILIAASYGTKPLVALLIEAGANIESITRVGLAGMTPIMRACENSKYDSVVYLANKGANVNHETKDGNTALMLCIVSSVKILKEIRTPSGIRKNDLYDTKMAEALGAIKALVEHGAKIDARRVNLMDGTKSITPLGIAIRTNRQEIIEYLKKLNAPDN